MSRLRNGLIFASSNALGSAGRVCNIKSLSEKTIVADLMGEIDIWRWCARTAMLQCGGGDVLNTRLCHIRRRRILRAREWGMRFVL